MSDAPQTKFDAERKAAFLLAYERSTEITAAAAAVGITRQTVYHHLHNDPEFASDFEKVDGRIDEMMMAQVKKLAIDGVEEHQVHPVTGKVIKTTIRYSERMLLAWLKRRRRSDWGDQVKVEQSGNVTHTHRTLDPKKIPRTARNRLRDAFAALNEQPEDDSDDPSRN